MARLLKPSTVLRRWEKAVDALKKELTAKCEQDGTKGRAKSQLISRASSKLAKQHAKMAGMKSMGEVKCAADLEKRKIPYSYETTTVEYQHNPQQYTPDFDIYAGEKKLYIEYKGKLDYDTRKKLLAVRSCNPGMDIHIVFEKPNNKIRKGSKTTYWMWAESKGFKWSEHTIREEWVNGDQSDQTRDKPKAKTHGSSRRSNKKES